MTCLAFEFSRRENQARLLSKKDMLCLLFFFFEIARPWYHNKIVGATRFAMPRVIVAPLRSKQYTKIQIFGVFWKFLVIKAGLKKKAPTLMMEAFANLAEFKRLH